ncbi:MAG TPA: hypothetical protein PK093_11200, partial [Phycisphaerae bacterium]|nr:hypothetical protein [Phycisphaerae bacterium]
LSQTWETAARKGKIVEKARVTFDSAEIVKDGYCPKNLKKVSHEFVFEPGTRPAGAVSWLKKVWEDRKPKRASITVVDEENEDNLIQVGPLNFEVFSAWDYDKIDIGINFEDWRQDAIMREIYAYRDHRRLTQRGIK